MLVLHVRLLLGNGNLLRAGLHFGHFAEVAVRHAHLKRLLSCLDVRQLNDLVALDESPCCSHLTLFCQVHQVCAQMATLEACMAQVLRVQREVRVGVLVPHRVLLVLGEGRKIRLVRADRRPHLPQRHQFPVSLRDLSSDLAVRVRVSFAQVVLERHVLGLGRLPCHIDPLLRRARGPLVPCEGSHSLLVDHVDLAVAVRLRQSARQISHITVLELLLVLGNSPLARNHGARQGWDLRVLLVLEHHVYAWGHEDVERRVPLAHFQITARRGCAMRTFQLRVLTLHDVDVIFLGTVLASLRPFEHFTDGDNRWHTVACCLSAIDLVPLQFFLQLDLGYVL